MLDNGDTDLGGTGALLVDVPGATPSQLVVALGKDRNAYVISRANLGGIVAPLAQATVGNAAIIQAAATYRTSMGTYVVLRASSSLVGAFRINPTNPPTITNAWSVSQSGRGSPFVTQVDGTNQTIVWAVGAGGSQRLNGYDGDTGAPVYTGGGANELMTGTSPFITGIVARGRIYVAANNRVYAFMLPSGGATPTPSPAATPTATPTPAPTLTPTPTPTPTPTATPTPAITPSPTGTPQRTAFDYDFDGKADVSVYRPSEGNWYLLRSRDGFSAVKWGVSSDKIVPADYDNDGKTDVAIYRPSEGNWYILRSSNGTLLATHFGVAEDVPVPMDFDGDHIADFGVFRPSTGTWYITRSGLPGMVTAAFGQSGDTPVPGDYEGLGRAELAVYRAANGTWYYSNDFVDPAHHFTSVPFGASTDLTTPADLDGDGKTDIAVYRPSNGFWYWLSSTGTTFHALQFGTSEDIPSAADFDGDGRADICVFRPSSGTWYRLNSSNGQFVATQFGVSGDKPTEAAFR